MRRSYFRLLEGVLFSLPLLFASCGNGDNALEEIINGGGSGGGSSTTENKYYVWDDTQLKLVATDIPSDAKEVTTATTKFEGGTYIVKSDVTCNAINVTADSKLIIYDGAKLTVTGHIEDETGGGTLTLSIYGQENQTGKLIITGVDTDGLWAKNIEIHGGDISVTTTTSTMPLHAIRADKDVSIYGGKVIATGADADASNRGANGIECGGNLTIKGEAIVKAYGGAKSGSQSGGKGINVGGTIDITGSADVYCKGRGNNSLYAEGNIVLSATKVEAESPVADGNAHGIFSNTGDITISGGTVIAASGANAIIASNLVINGGTVTATSNSNIVEAIRGYTSLNITTGVNKVEMINPSANSVPTAADANKFAGTGGTITLGGVDTNFTTWNGYSVSDAIAAYPKLSYDGTTKTLTYVP